MLELKDISKNYLVDKKPFPALKKVNLFFNNAEFCSILGPSGCGKTTLLNIIGGLDQYSDGDLLIDGVSTKVYNDRDWDNYRNKTNFLITIVVPITVIINFGGNSID